MLSIEKSRDGTINDESIIIDQVGRTGTRRTLQHTCRPCLLSFIVIYKNEPYVSKNKFEFAER